MIDWVAWERIGLIIDAASGALFLLLGLFVGFVQPRTKLSLAFGSFAGAFGVFYLISNIGTLASGALGGYGSPWQLALYTALHATMIVALLGVADRFPDGARERRGPTAAVRLALVGLAAANLLWLFAFRAEIMASHAVDSFSLVAGERIGSSVADAALAAFLIVLAWRWPNAEPSKRRAIVLVAVGLGLYQMLQSGIDLLGVIDEEFHFHDNNAVRVVSALAAATSWLVAAGRSPHGPSRVARNIALLYFGLIAAGALYHAMLPSAAPARNLGILGLLRAAGVFMLAYSILKHQLFDIDLKLKFGIKQSTVVAIVIAVFVGVQTFVSESFTDSAGIWAGAVATGVMVLAIRPLQTLGQKVADRAMPNVRPLTERSDDERVEMYRQLAESAWSDGALSRAEGRVLETAREQLGLTAEQAMRVEATMRG